MQYYRGAGFEVALLLDLADGSDGEKATETLKGALTVVSEVTGILESRSGVLQNDQEVSYAVVDQLAASRHRLLVYNSCVNQLYKWQNHLGFPLKAFIEALTEITVMNELCAAFYMEPPVAHSKKAAS